MARHLFVDSLRQNNRWARAVGRPAEAGGHDSHTSKELSTWEAATQTGGAAIAGSCGVKAAISCWDSIRRGTMGLEADAAEELPCSEESV